MKSVYILWDQNGMIRIFSTIEGAKNFFRMDWIEFDTGVEWISGRNYRITCESVD